MEETILNGEVLAAEEDETGTYFLLLSVVVVVLLAVAYFWKSGSDSSSKRSSASSSFSSSSSSSSSGLKTSGGVGLNRSNSKLGAEDLAGRPTLKVFWGSQTGTAEDFAQGLCDEAKKLGFNPQSIDLEDYDKEDLENEERAIFVMATYGEGEPTDNAKEFYEWIMDESLDSEMLSSLKFSVFGLGNRTYEHYNAIGRAMDSRLEALGATRIYDRGEGDDDSSLEEDFMNWKKDLWGPFCKAAGLPPPGNMQNDTVAPRLKMVVLKDVPAEQQLHALGTLKPGLTYDLKNPYIAEVVVNRELHKPSSDRSCRHIEFHVGEATSLKYEPGDHLGVYAHNSAAMVEALAERLNIQ
ncbi:NADPH--cytochrome P450 reductase, partial [Balamuthia mandrillaris]